MAYKDRNTAKNNDKNYSLELQSSGLRIQHKPPLLPLYLGREQCAPSHTYSRSRDHWILHYVESGTGVVYTQQREYALGPGQVFLISPGKDHWYQADSLNPWTYQWVGFQGPDNATLAQWLGLRDIPPVFKTHAGFLTSFEKLKDALSQEQHLPQIPLELMALMIELLQSLLYRLIPRIQTTGSVGSAFLTPWDRIDGFLEAHFCEPITIEDLCQAGNVSRMELYRLIKSRTDHSPKEFLTHLRMDHAKLLLADRQRPVSRVASLCGYREYQSFTRQFRRWFGMSPREFRDRELGSHIIAAKE